MDDLLIHVTLLLLAAVAQAALMSIFNLLVGFRPPTLETGIYHFARSPGMDGIAMLASCLPDGVRCSVGIFMSVVLVLLLEVPLRLLAHQLYGPTSEQMSQQSISLRSVWTISLNM